LPARLALPPGLVGKDAGKADEGHDDEREVIVFAGGHGRLPSLRIAKGNGGGLWIEALTQIKRLLTRITPFVMSELFMHEGRN
jgi:hypothetical protein